jgi:hypothetical protein
MLKPTCILLIVFSATLAGCSGGSSSGVRVGEPGQPPTPRLIHTPPIDHMTAQQLRSLSMECEKYVADKSTRGPYDADYCEKAIAAWGDSPLQIVTIDNGVRIPDAVAPGSQHVNPAGNH